MITFSIFITFFFITVKVSYRFPLFFYRQCAIDVETTQTTKNLDQLSMFFLTQTLDAKYHQTTPPPPLAFRAFLETKAVPPFIRTRKVRVNCPISIYTCFSRLLLQQESVPVLLDLFSLLQRETGLREYICRVSSPFFTPLRGSQVKARYLGRV